MNRTMLELTSSGGPEESIGFLGYIGVLFSLISGGAGKREMFPEKMQNIERLGFKILLAKFTFCSGTT